VAIHTDWREIACRDGGWSIKRDAMTETILRHKELFNSACRHVIHAPIETVDLATWLLKLPDAEYCRCCPPDHIACGTTTTDGGIPMSINVEMIGKTLMIQHYSAELATPTLCRMVSTSDAFTPDGRTRVEVIWTLSAERIDEQTCEYRNTVLAHPTLEFMEFIAKHNISSKMRRLRSNMTTETIRGVKRRSSRGVSSGRRSAENRMPNGSMP
jgi:hypothetical protein